MDLDLRTSLTAGAGKAFVRTNSSNLYSALAVQANREVSMGEGQFNLEGVIRAVYSVFIFENPEVSFNLSGDLIPSLSNLGRVRTNIDSSLNWEIFDDLYLKWTFYLNYDNKPLSDTAEKYDWAISLIGVEYKL
jgi:hypothetical protein